MPGSNACFPPDSIVTTPSGDTPISSLQLGDEVLTWDSVENDFRYTEVIAWLSRSGSGSIIYLAIKTESGHDVTLTGNHLIFYSTNRRGPMTSTMARNLLLGNFIYIREKEAKALNVSRIVRIERKELIGSSAPLTRHGTLIVDRVLSSCYAYEWLGGLIGHGLIHNVFFAPIRGISHTFNALRSLVDCRHLMEYVLSVENGKLWYVHFWKFVHSFMFEL